MANTVFVFTKQFSAQQQDGPRMNRTQIAKFSMKTPNLRSESHSGSLVKPCWETNFLSQFSLGAKKQTFLVSKRIQKVGILVVLQTPSSTQSQERKNEKRRRISSKSDGRTFGNPRTRKLQYGPVGKFRPHIKISFVKDKFVRILVHIFHQRWTDQLPWN